MGMVYFPNLHLDILFHDRLEPLFCEPENDGIY